MHNLEFISNILQSCTGRSNVGALLSLLLASENSRNLETSASPVKNAQKVRGLTVGSVAYAASKAGFSAGEQCWQATTLEPTCSSGLRAARCRRIMLVHGLGLDLVLSYLPFHRAPLYICFFILLLRLPAPCHRCYSVYRVPKTRTTCSRLPSGHPDQDHWNSSPRL